MKLNPFNPFLRLAGFQALLPGLAIIIITAFLAGYGRVHFDGALDMHLGAVTHLAWYFIEPFVALFSLILCLYFSGLIFSKSNIRFIDVAGTVSLSRTPMFFIAVLAFIPGLAVTDPYHMTIVQKTFAFVSLFFLIWMIALLYNAYTVSCNIKGTKAIVTFIGALLCAELISKYLIINLYPLIK